MPAAMSNLKGTIVISRILVATVALVLLSSLACKKDPPPAKVDTTSAPSDPAKQADDLQALREFVKKDQPVAAAPGTSMPPNHPGAAGTTSSNDSLLPPGHPPLPSSNPPPADTIAYERPEAWKEEPVKSQLRKAQFLIPRAEGDSEDGQMVVFYFGPGQGGGVEGNIERWKSMFSTADGKPVPDSQAKRDSKEVDGMKVTTLDVTGRYADPMAGKTTAAPQDWRMLAAIVETPDGPWFFKAVGPMATMNAHQQSFDKFVTSIKKRK